MTNKKEDIELMKKRGIEIIEKWIEEELKKENEQNDHNDNQK